MRVVNIPQLVSMEGRCDKREQFSLVTGCPWMHDCHVRSEETCRECITSKHPVVALVLNLHSAIPPSLFRFVQPCGRDIDPFTVVQLPFAVVRLSFIILMMTEE